MICEVCNAEYGDLALNLGEHPLCDDLTPIGSDFTIPKYVQMISLCESCLTAHQLVPVEKELLFKPNYHYRASLTKDVLTGMRNLVHDLEFYFANNNESKVVLDIGCNDGSLLGIFKESYACQTIGVDPTDAILESNDRIDFKYNDYFNRKLALAIRDNHPFIDVITFTNVFAHIENLPELLNNLALLISDSTTLVIENHYLGSILSRNQFDTFYHEHPRTYSLRSFEFIAKSLNLCITDVHFPSRYGGNIRVSMKRLGVPADLSDFQRQEEGFIDAFSALQSEYDQWRIKASKTLEALLSKGVVYGKALPGRAVMLINSLELNNEKMPVVFEQPSSPKVGNYVPSTKIQVLSDELIPSYDPQVLIVWSWHIVDEITQYLNSLGYRGEIWVPLPEFTLHRAAL